MTHGKARRPAAEDALGRYLRDIVRYRLITREEEIQLGQRAAAGEREAVDALVQANLRFVVAVAKRYRTAGVPLADLVAEGNVGLLRAAERFDPDQGIRFISYAVWWVRQAILHALAEQSGAVRVPVNRAGVLHAIRKRSAALAQLLEREPTAAELADELGIDAAEVDVVLRSARAPVSLDAPAEPDGGGTLGDRLADRRAAPTDGALLDRARTDAIGASLARLSERESRVLRLYYGLDGEPPRTLEEIASLLGVTRERVRQIREKALARLRQPRRARVLEPFVR